MTTIFVAKLDFGVTDVELRQAFESYGTVSKVTIAKDKETDKPRGFAFVEMPNDHEADAAIDAMDGYTFNGRSCVVKKADDRGDGGNTRPQRDGNSFQNRGPRSNDNRERPGNRDFQNRPPREGGFQNREPRDTRDNTRVDRSSGDEAVTPPIIQAAPVKKLKVAPKKDVDTTQDGKNKKTKLNPYKKSGKDSVSFEDDEDDLEIDLFGFNDDEDEIDDEIASQYLINSDDDDEWDDDEDYDDEDYDDEDEDY